MWIVPLFLACAACKPGTVSTAQPPALPPDEHWQGKLVLGSPSLTAGIPGEGPLTLAEIKQWLADKKNHEPLDVCLPLGLRSETAPPIPPDNPLTRAKIELGRQLFFDRRLSQGGILACVDCHHPQREFTSDEIRHVRLRETAVAFNRILSREQFWDGRAPSLEDQLRFPLESEHEFHTTTAECIERIGKIEGYRLQFAAIFGHVDYESLCQAVAAYERALVTGPSAWDYDVELKRLQALDSKALTPAEQEWFIHVKEAAGRQPLSSAARRGAALFFGARAGCSRCHSGPNFTDEQYHDVGLRTDPDPKSPIAQKESEDLGRFQVTRNEEDRHRFKTPTLRNVALTWPYMHNARYTELLDVVEHFERGGEAAKSDIEQLDLSPAEIADLVAFLQALTGSLPKPPMDRLPP